MSEIHDRGRAAYGGVKIGCAFLGFAAAYGVATLSTSVAVYVAAMAGTPVLTPTGLQDLFARASPEPGPAAQVLGYGIGLVALFVAYYLGGYVAGRMARFYGARQGVAVWVWGLVVSVAIVVLTLLFETDAGSAARLVSDVPLGVLVGVVVVLAVQLVGAVLGGLAGMRFHRAVDRASVGV